MNVIDWDTIWRSMVIAPTVLVSVGYGYYLAIRGTDEDVKNLKEAAKELMKR